MNCLFVFHGWKLSLVVSFEEGQSISVMILVLFLFDASFHGLIEW